MVEGSLHFHRSAMANRMCLGFRIEGSHQKLTKGESVCLGRADGLSGGGPFSTHRANARPGWNGTLPSRVRVSRRRCITGACG